MSDEDEGVVAEAEAETGQDLESVEDSAPAPVTLDSAPSRAVYSVPVEVIVCVGKARPPIGELINMRRDAVIVLDRRIDDPVDIRVGDRVIARGELQELEDGSGRLGVRMTEIVESSGDF